MPQWEPPVGDFNIPLVSMDRSFRQKMGKEAMALNNTLDHMNLADTSRTLHPKAAVFFKYSGNVLQDGSHVMPQNKSQ